MHRIYTSNLSLWLHIQKVEWDHCSILGTIWVISVFLRKQKQNKAGRILELAEWGA